MMRYEHMLGLEWQHGVADCYALARTVYRESWGLQLRDYAYPERWWEDAPELDLLMRNFRNEGFVPITTDNHFALHPGDGLLIARGTRVASHCGVWVGGNRFLHHPFGGVSCVERWAGKWAGMTLAIVRHPEIPPLPPPEKVDIIDLMPAHQREKYRAMLAERATARVS